MKPLVITVLILGVVIFAGADQPGASAPDPDDAQTRPMRAPPPRGRFDRPLNEHEVRQALQVMRRIDPEMAEHLSAAYEEHPERVARKLQEQFPHLRRFMHIRERDEEMFNLRVEQIGLMRRAARLRGRYWAAVDAGHEQDMARVETELAVALDEQFEVQLRVWEREIERLEMRLEELRERVQEHAENRDDLIAGQLEDMLESRPERWREPWFEGIGPPRERPGERGDPGP